MHNDPRFELLGVDRPKNEPNGRTDIDLVLRHRETGELCHVEVKDVKPRSQRSDIARLKRKIDLMAAEYKRTGKLQAFVNRGQVIPELKYYASRRRVPVFENVRQRQFGSEVLDDLHERSRAKVRLALLGESVEVLTGVLLATEYGGAVRRDLEILQSPERRNAGAWLRLGHDSSLAVAGTAMTVSGLSSAASRLGLTATWLGRTKVAGKWAGAIGIGLTVSADAFEEGVAVWEYRQGAIGRRELVRTSVNTGTSTGAIALGATIGTFIEPGGGTLVGAGIGALVAWPAARGATYALDRHYTGIDTKQKKELEDFIYAHYGVK